MTQPTDRRQSHAPQTPLRRLVLVLGDQLWLGNPALADFDATHDAVLMIEAHSEGTAVWSHKARIALFLSAMRHFCNEVHRQGWRYHYVALDDGTRTLSFADHLREAIQRLKPEIVQVCEPGEWRMLETVQNTASACDVPLQVLPDTHFMCSREQFARWASGRKELRMEYFYREMRRQHGVLVQGRGKTAEPEGGQWNFDAENRQGYPKTGPGDIPPPALFAPDRVTTEVLALVAKHFPDHPGSLDHFVWPVTRAQGLEALQRFVDARLEHFGPHQDAMWTGTPWGWHGIISVALNLHLIDPREVIAAAEQAYRERGLPLASVEGFIRQVLGWREFIRGMYWLDMPQMKTANHYNHQRRLPAWYWTGETQMACMRDVVGQTLKYGFAHHIQRLMVTGQFALLAEISPQQVADWYLAVYVDAIEWVELPNVAGMALYADGGRFTSKPYIASGQYIKRMSNYCQGCRYKPDQRTGEDACPVTTLYWHFLDRHEPALKANARTALMVRNIARLSEDERASIRSHAAYVLNNLDAL